MADIWVGRMVRVLVVSVLILLPCRVASAASTGALSLYTPQADGAGTANGDYISATPVSGGLYRYFIEQPAGLGQFVVSIFDADFGAGGATEDTATPQRDRARTTFGSVTYSLIRPDGTTAATQTCASGATTAFCVDNTWTDLLNSTNATNRVAGHWELRVDETVGGSNGINAIGIRANDGTSGGGGTEIPIYYDSHNQLGQNPPSSGSGTKTYKVYPYLTSGCTANENDFDYDSNNAGSQGSIALSSRTGAVTQTIASAALSVDDTWARNTINAWTTDTNSTEGGIWTATIDISNYTTGAGVNGNYANVWFGNSSAAANPPTANPTTNAFRVYLPNDAGGTPVKTYVEQQLTYGGCGAGNNGPNPPATGQTTCFTVTVRVVNPEAQAITFSAANLVTANIPGVVARVAYAGLATVTQGTITAQPAVGAIGNVTWNPGTVGAGSTVILAYRVKVTPSAAGQRNPVTGTVASGNGTRAQYRDQTGNNTQARALYLFGPICELAATQGLLTEALVSGFRAYEDSGAVALEWETASEAGTIGFYVERFDATRGKFVRVSKDLLPALMRPEGGMYRFVDPTASSRDAMPRYRLIEVRADGQRTRLGPFDVRVDWEHGRSAKFAGAEDFERAERASAHREAPIAEAARLGGGIVTQKPVDSLRIGVRETGIQFISSSALASALGETQSTVESMLSRGSFTLSKQGQPVWWLADPITRKKPSAGMYFYGEAIHDLYSPDQAYRLTRAAGPVMPTVSVATGAGSLGDTFVDLKHAEVDAFPLTVVPLDPESDYWFWDGFSGGGPAKTYSLDAPGAGGAGSATLKLHFQGASSSGVTDEHRVQASLNGVPVGDWQWTGIAPSDASFPVSATTLLESGNQLQLTALLGGGASQSFTDFDYADLTYPRAYRAATDALVFRPDGHAALSVSGFSTADVRLFDVGNPLQPRSLVGATSTSNAGLFGIGFTPPSGSSTYAAIGPNGGKTPSLRPWIDGQLKASGRGADYLVVTTAALSSAAQRLANARQMQGLRTAVVDVEAVMNEFNGGRSNPHALHDFLAYAASFWNPAPRYVVLAGAGSLDYRNLLGGGDSLVPTILVSTAGGLFGSDNRVADLSGNDGIPDVAVGRIPATTAQQLNDYVDKLLAYEADPGAWAGTMLALADAQDQGANFSADSDQVLSHLPGNYGPIRIYLDNTTLGAARTQLLGSIASGASFADYLGHGALDRLSGSGLLNSGDVVSLQNGSKLPILTAMTCEVNRFTVPGIPALGEQLITHAGGGAAAVWAPSALSIQSEARVLAEKFYSVVAAGQNPRLGDVVQQALRSFQISGGSPSMFDIYVLLGDPALRWKVAPPTPPASGGNPSAGVE
ncbi:MAG: C25 family cysteine peptidase [Acidobacteriota bacterium]